MLRCVGVVVAGPDGCSHRVLQELLSFNQSNTQCCRSSPNSTARDCSCDGYKRSTGQAVAESALWTLRGAVRSSKPDVIARCLRSSINKYNEWKKRVIEERLMVKYKNCG